MTYKKVLQTLDIFNIHLSRKFSEFLIYSTFTKKLYFKPHISCHLMFTSDEWTLNKLSKEFKGKEAAKVVLMPFFWNSVVYTL